MGFSFKKFAKKALKFGAKIAVPILAKTPIGAAAIQGAKVFKSLGGNMKAARLGKLEPLSVQAAIAKPAMQLASSSRIGKRNFVPVPKEITGKASQKPKRTTGRGRTPPSGGLDLKAIAAKWRAQGKPGTWIEFIKANPIRK